MNHYDIIVIGGGAAGLSAALVLSPGRRIALVVDAGSSRNTPAVHVHRYLSWDGMPTAELPAAGNIVDPSAPVRTGPISKRENHHDQHENGNEITVKRPEGCPRRGVTTPVFTCWAGLSGDGHRTRRDEMAADHQP